MSTNACVLLKTGNIRSPKCRLVWPHVFKAKKGDDDQSKPKYTAAILIPKGADLTLLKNAASKAFADEFGNSTKPAGSPFKDTAEVERIAEFAEDYPTLINISRNESSGMPGITTTVIDPATGKLEVIGPDRADEVYGGRWVYVTLNAFAWTYKSRKGVSIGLNNIQLLDDDDPIGGGRVSASSEFEPAEIGGESGGDASSMF